ncbi:hypothetical protein IMZ31_20505 (plasmid) [Pontibacillus sp. ALD_SL1]|uniref:single-stranded-DNA-specific exonuclease RecJ n=1 Tax=Pontibacillus sp. ALD_SL1 TaxID=2777185 RepID=UPI001A97233C|nr:DHH family phosphoesterase [Pontibacillus sp. ALD_SL1]QST02932.1 hypothetical protein IMZ31_20505 [Pontibacillus sp. ALD_SL1]
MSTRWFGPEVNDNSAEALSKTLSIPPSIAQVFLSMGISNKEDIQSFVKPPLNGLHNPFLMLDMKKGVERISEAIRGGERILIYGDYDCDGVTTVSVFKKAFNVLGVKVDVFVPNRFKEGYGPNVNKLKTCMGDYDLIITGDTGIRSFEAANLLKDTPCDFIVTDHHEPMEGKLATLFQDFLKKSSVDKEMFEAYMLEQKIEVMQSEHFLPSNGIIEIRGDEYIVLPDAYAVIDPKRLRDPYPFKSLAGVGVAFKVMQAVFIKENQDVKPLFRLLDYVAAGTIADLANQIEQGENGMDLENRILCKYGIQLMNKDPEVWVKTLSTISGIEGGGVDSTAIGFRIGPMLNAPGRLEDPTLAVQFLLEEDPEQSKTLASKLKSINEKRKSQTKNGYEMMQSILEEAPPSWCDFGIVAVAPEENVYHIGVAGLVASKIQQHYYRPTIALSPVMKEGKVILKGSARSIPGVHILHCLDEVKKEIGLYEYGGHEQAAGLSLEPERVEDFRRAFRKAVQAYPKEVFTPLIRYQSLMEFKEADEWLMKLLSKLEPFGEGNRKPLFRSNRVIIRHVKEIMGGRGCILTLCQGNVTLKGITFTEGERILKAYHRTKKHRESCEVDLLYTPEYNEFRGVKNIQLLVEDMKFM